MEGEVANSKKFFQDNLRYINAKTDPAMFNLNNGLAAMSEEIAQLQSDVDAIRQAIAQLLRSR